MCATRSSLAVMFGGPSPEHDVSILTGLQALHALARSGEVREVQGIYWSKTGGLFEVPLEAEASAFLEGPPPASRPLELVIGTEAGFRRERGRFGGRGTLSPEAVLVCCHGGPGEDGALQGALDCAGIAYSGPSAAGAALGMDKLATSGVLESAGLPTLPRVALGPGAPAPDFPGPYLVKPRFGGSSIGIEVVVDHPSALALARTSVHLRRGAVIEPYRPDLYDLQIGVRTFPDLELSAIERPLRRSSGAILDYADKYVAGEGMAGAPRELPARIDEAVATELRALAARAAALLGARGIARLDFLSDGTELFVNEINTVPGSLARYLFVEPPRDFVELLLDLAAEAVERPAAQFSSAGSNGLVLRDAQSIAAKLA